MTTRAGCVRRLTDQPPPPWLDDLDRSVPRGREPLPFATEEYERRHRAIREAMEAVGVDRLINFRMSSIDWLTGFHSIAYFVAAAVVDAGAVTLLLPESEIGRAQVGSCADEIRFFGSGETVTAQIAGLLAERPDLRIGIDMESPGAPAGLVGELADRRVHVVDSGQLVERRRLTLSGPEQEEMRRAAAVTAQGWDAALAAAAATDPTDSRLAAALLGALCADADSIARGNVAIATDWRGGVTHSTWNGTPLVGATYLEFAGASHRYSTPVMRTVVRGRPSSTVRRLTGYATTALGAVLDGLRPGVAASTVADRAKAELGTLPDDVVFHWNFGYPAGIGQITTWMDGASFFLTSDNHEELRPGMAFHIPMSFRALGVAGVGLSQTVLLREDGVEVLTADAGPAELVEMPG
jgi:Xaa-Pro aminopeptidase